MANKASSPSLAGNRTTVRQAGRGRRAKVKFGSVVVTGASPTRTAVEQNIERSREAFERLSARLAKPGVRLPAKKNIPLFAVDEHDPSIFIRRLNGRVERGHVIDGVFRVID